MSNQISQYGNDTTICNQIDVMIYEIKERIEQLRSNGWKIDAQVEVNMEKHTIEKHNLVGVTAIALTEDDLKTFTDAGPGPG